MTITAKVIKDSVNPNGTRITTFELEYPRFIHAELLVHRQFSRNSASSRAIPISKVTEQVINSMATPIHWGKNQSGMQAKEELEGEDRYEVMDLWYSAGFAAANTAMQMHKIGAHKQIANRILEPFQTMKVIVTATEFANFFWLRDHPDAQPEIKELAIRMKEAIDSSIPDILDYDMWHVPYIRSEIINACQKFFDDEDNEITTEQAIRVSCSCCAQVSYRKLDTTIEKAEKIYDLLVNSEPVHASAFEHVALTIDRECVKWEDGVTHVDKDGFFWSGNFRDWIQYRQLIPNNAKKGYYDSTSRH